MCKTMAGIMLEFTKLTSMHSINLLDFENSDKASEIQLEISNFQTLIGKLDTNISNQLSEQINELHEKFNKYSTREYESLIKASYNLKTLINSGYADSKNRIERFIKSTVLEHGVNSPITFDYLLMDYPNGLCIYAEEDQSYAIGLDIQLITMINTTIHWALEAWLGFQGEEYSED